jgi:elongator complex protein 3
MTESDATIVRDGDRRLDALLASVEAELRAAPQEQVVALVEQRLQRALKKHERRRVLERIAPELVSTLRAKPVRSRSGVAPLSLLTKPFPCPGRCVFCPNDVRMPKSYLSMEPGAQRATRNKFDPYAQTWNRLLAFARNGHPIDKIELIVMGGTFSAYPEEYQRWFVTRTFAALNEFDPSRGPVDAPANAHDFLDCDDAEVNTSRAGYDQRVVKHLRAKHDGSLLATDELATWDDVALLHARNERAAARCVGLSIETRPDRIDEAEIVRLRRLGVTKVQLGYQSTDDSILERNRRGTTVAAARAATRLLRGAGFKVQGHWMPNLLGADPTRDAADFANLFADSELRPDELKIYPCALIESAELRSHHLRGEWRPYADQELVDLLVQTLVDVPRYCRVSRVIRDIPSHDIVEGNKQSNLREVATREAARRGLRIQDIRARQIARVLTPGESVAIATTEYPLNGGVEVFIEATTDRDELLGFVRLHLPSMPPLAAFAADLRDAALVRELHVYGQVARLGEHDGEHAQHRGLGRELMARAEHRALVAAHSRVAVIAAVGTREYYRRLGYRDGEFFLVKELGP